MRYYLAGGAVRDILLGKAPKDHDVVFAGNAQDFIALNPSAYKVADDPEIFILNGCEYTALRGATPQEDLSARDLTINAFLLEESGKLHMHPLALEDLLARRLRPASDKSFSQDPLRVFRVARFAATLPEFAPSPDCLKLMEETQKLGLLEGLAAERVGQELRRALSAPKPGNFLRVLEQAGCLAPWFSPLEQGVGKVAGPPKYHQHSVIGHIADIMDKSAEEFASWLNDSQKADDTACPPPANETGETSRPNRQGDSKKQNDSKKMAQIHELGVWMALCHDIGKALTEQETLPHHYGHETSGEAPAHELALRLALPAEYRKAARLASRLHMKAGRYPELRPGTRIDLLMEAHNAGLLLPLFLLAQADSGKPGLLERAEKDLQTILKVSLPEEWRNQGEKSGQRLRELRCAELANIR